MLAVPSNQHNFLKIPSIDRDRYLLDIPEEWNIVYNPVVKNYPDEQVGAGFMDWIKKLKPIVAPIAKKILPVATKQITKYVPKSVKDVVQKGLQVIDSTPGQRLRDLVIKQLPETATVAGKKFNVRSIASDISNIFLPKLIQKMKGSGMKPKMPMTKIKKQVRAAIMKRLKNKRGGAIGAILGTLASAIPTAIEVGKTVWPHIKKAFQWIGRKLFPKLFKKNEQQGSGDSNAIKYLSEDIAKFLHRRATGRCGQYGEGIGDLFKKFVGFVKRVFHRGKSIFKNVAPLLKKGWEMIPSDIRSKILPTVQSTIEKHIGVKIPLSKVPEMMKDPRIKEIVSATIGKL